MEFPIFKTKFTEPLAPLGPHSAGQGSIIEGKSKTFNLIDPKEREEYFQFKAGPEIKRLREYLKENSFIAYLLGKKNAGKGTYSKMFSEIIGPERVIHFSIGDMIREVDKELINPVQKKELFSFLKKNYRGWVPLEEIMKSLEQRSTETLLPTELILALTKREIEKKEKKTIFIDGFPRDLDQISFSLFFRDLIGYREDPDIFILIDVPESVIDERLKYRRICPVCKTPKNLKLLPTKKIGYHQDSKEFYLLCDNPECQEVEMVQKEGDEKGIELIKERLTRDEKLIKRALSLYGIPKVLLRNSVPRAKVKDFVDDYEITPEYTYEWLSKEKKVRVKERPWQVLDDKGEPSFSLLPAPVVVSLIKQLDDILIP